MTIIQGDNVNVLQLMHPDHIDLTVTSPPYDNMRSYNGYSFDFDTIARELFRVTKPGGIVAWVVGDATVNGSETGTSFRQALFFKEIGFNLETMIWEKTGSGALGSQNFYSQNFEYIFILTKGVPKTFNPIKDRANVVKSGMAKVNSSIDDKGKSVSRTIERKPFGKRNNIWRINPTKNSEHPAVFPETLAKDCIISWSNPGDLVLDPFCGSGTTGKMALLNGRRFIGVEISSEYCDLARARLEASGHGS